MEEHGGCGGRVGEGNIEVGEAERGYNGRVDRIEEWRKGAMIQGCEKL